ncbi:MAG TPA: hypothetical protein VHZ74_10645 [Bryobacteraceae bacterium]|nr:hypothetical protein [Bryobacteraceae bacterium]
MTIPQHPTQAQRRRIESAIRRFADHERWAEESLTIRNQQGMPVPFRTFPGPHKLNLAIEKQRRQGKPIRIISVKARRVFMSAGIATHGFKHVTFWPGRHGLVVAHRKDSAEEIFDYYNQFAKGYKPAGADLNCAIEIPARAKAGNDEGQIIRYANSSWLRVATAGSKDIGRAMGLHFLHISEAAFIAHMRSVCLGLLSTMPDDAETMAFKESTANGASGEFYEDWMDASDPRSGSGWDTVFLAWWEHPANTMRLSVPDDEFDRSLTGAERVLQRTYNLTFEQLHWRRWAITNKCGRSEKQFAQEYPSCPEEAFLLSGRPRFTHVSLARMPIIRNPITGELESVETDARSELLQKRILFRAAGEDAPPGPLLLYRRPEPGKLYAIGADPASGADPNYRAGDEADSDPDYSSAQALDTSSGEQVAKIRERWTPPLFAEYLCKLGKWFNWAYLVIEANNHGQAVIQEVLRLKYPLERIHVKRRVPGDRRPPMLDEIGFLTNTATRPLLVSGLDEAVNEMSVIIRDANTLKECLGFVIWPDGVARAQRGKGNHDDDVLALALAIVGLKHAPRLTREQLERKQREFGGDGGALRSVAQIVRYGRFGAQRPRAEED